MSEESTFLQALLASPNDDPLRRVYADWLEERGDARATFLRLEVARHQNPSENSEVREQLFQARRHLDPRWVARIERPRSGWRIVRTRPAPQTYGRAIPAFIHNGSYFHVTVDVYADGAINCWGFVDWPLFQQKLAQGWVVSRAKIGENVSFHNLGHADVAQAEWTHTTADLEREVWEALRELNPTLEGLLDMQGSDTEIRNGIRYAKLGMEEADPYRVSLDGTDVLAKALPVFEVTDEGYRLQPWFIYADGQTQLGYASDLLTMEAVAERFAEGRCTLSVPNGAWVILDGLGRFQTGDGFWYVQPEERLREARGLLEELNGSPGLIAKCIEARVEYESSPSEERREALRQAYEAVPEHRRHFCGDMDSKDGPIRRILYGGWDEEE